MTFRDGKCITVNMKGLSDLTYMKGSPNVGCLGTLFLLLFGSTSATTTTTLSSANTTLILTTFTNGSTENASTADQSTTIATTEALVTSCDESPNEDLVQIYIIAMAAEGGLILLLVIILTCYIIHNPPRENRPISGFETPKQMAKSFTSTTSSMYDIPRPVDEVPRGDQYEPSKVISRNDIGVYITASPR